MRTNTLAQADGMSRTAVAVSDLAAVVAFVRCVALDRGTSHGVLYSVTFLNGLHQRADDVKRSPYSTGP
jgi:hypothetical protein